MRELIEFLRVQRKLKTELASEGMSKDDLKKMLAFVLIGGAFVMAVIKLYVVPQGEQMAANNVLIYEENKERIDIICSEIEKIKGISVGTGPVKNEFCSRFDPAFNGYGGDVYQFLSLYIIGLVGVFSLISIVTYNMKK